MGAPTDLLNPSGASLLSQSAAQREAIAPPAPSRNLAHFEPSRNSAHSAPAAVPREEVVPVAIAYSQGWRPANCRGERGSLPFALSSLIHFPALRYHGLRLHRAVFLKIPPDLRNMWTRHASLVVAAAADQLCGQKRRWRMKNSDSAHSSVSS